MPSAKESKDDKSKVHKLSIKGSARLVAEFFEYSINSILFQRGVYPPEDFTTVKKYGLNILVTSDDQVKSYIKRIISQLNKWMAGGKISKLVVVITSKDTGEHVERWQFDVRILSGSSSNSNNTQPGKSSTSSSAAAERRRPAEKENADSNATPPPPPPQEKSEAQIQSEIQSIFRQITASVTFLPTLDQASASASASATTAEGAAGGYTFNVLVYADADSDVPIEWGDSDAKEVRDAEKVQLRGFSTNSHRVDTLVSYRVGE